jgi:hypothetical protein
MMPNGRALSMRHGHADAEKQPLPTNNRKSPLPFPSSRLGKVESSAELRDFISFEQDTRSRKN